ncbi:MAG: flavin reductase family protein [Treponema sp.]|jgi:flavin reductase (DIM6/NTAB) family NADH-FMN oxidoreductase RutF|nr:flavin reductase family protein [Treponema sp.]
MTAAIEKTVIHEPFRPVFPTPAGLIVSADEDGKPNIMTAGEIFNIGLKNPCIIGIALRKATYSHGLISRTGEFTANLPSRALLEKVDGIGMKSGRDGRDKFADFGLCPLPSLAVKPPIVGECPVNLECKVLSVTTVGDHDLFLGEVLCMRVDADKVGKNQRMLIDKMEGFLYAEWEYYEVGRKLGNFGLSAGKDLRLR